MLNTKGWTQSSADERQEKPDELKKYEQMKALGLPVWAEVCKDQPHIWLEMRVS